VPECQVCFVKRSVSLFDTINPQSLAHFAPELLAHFSPEYSAKLQNIETSLVHDQKIVTSFDNPTYTAMTNEINKVGEAIERINIAKLKYSELLISLSELVEKYD